MRSAELEDALLEMLEGSEVDLLDPVELELWENEALVDEAVAEAELSSLTFEETTTVSTTM